MTRTMFVTVGLVILVSSGISKVEAHDNTHGKVLLLMVDGMRWDLFGLDLPALKKVEENGVKAEWLDPVYVTFTNPSAFSIATGLYVESHGVLLNVDFDPVTLERSYTFPEGVNKTKLWNQNGAEPIWVGAINQGHKAGTIQYPGGNVAINGVEPTRRVFNAPWFWENYPNKQAIDDCLSWLQEDKFDLVLLYFDNPDTILHELGIGHPRTVEVIKSVDEDIGYLFERLESEGLSDITDVIIVSDHGHVQLDPEKTIMIYDYVDPEDVHMLITYYSLFQLEPKEGQLDKVLQMLNGAHNALHVYKRENFPKSFHYGDNSQNLQILGYVDSNWQVFPNSSGQEINGASHGFDNGDMDMKSIFYAQGPNFKEGYQKEHFESVNVYLLMCELLGIEPAPNNGSRKNYEDILEHSNSNQCVCVLSSNPTMLTLLYILFFFLLLL